MGSTVSGTGGPVPKHCIRLLTMYQFWDRTTSPYLVTLMYTSFETMGSTISETGCPVPQQCICPLTKYQFWDHGVHSLWVRESQATIPQLPPVKRVCMSSCIYNIKNICNLTNLKWGGALTNHQYNKAHWQSIKYMVNNKSQEFLKSNSRLNLSKFISFKIQLKTNNF